MTNFSLARFDPGPAAWDALLRAALALGPPAPAPAPPAGAGAGAGAGAAAAAAAGMGPDDATGVAWACEQARDCA